MIEIQDWGLIDYDQALKKQRELVADIQEKRDRSVLVFCEHPTVITIGRNGTADNIKTNFDFLRKSGVQVAEVDRGGDVTLHNPGQLVGYPIFNLEAQKQDLHWFLREIEASVIEALADYGLQTHRMNKFTGVWIDEERKICAMGLHCSRWVTSHGFALNVNNNVGEFCWIVPCGITDKKVTSMKLETGKDIDMSELKSKLSDIFLRRFGG